jgi:SPP1 family predicted phage head-tail adaptor
VNPGKLRHRITIQQESETSDSMGGNTIMWNDVATVWASINPLSGKEYYDAEQVQSEVSHKIRIRYRSGITSDMRIDFKGRIFKIVSPPINWEERDREMMLMCREET